MAAHFIANPYIFAQCHLVKVFRLKGHSDYSKSLTKWHCPSPRGGVYRSRRTMIIAAIITGR